MQRAARLNVRSEAGIREREARDEASCELKKRNRRGTSRRSAYNLNQKPSFWEGILSVACRLKSVASGVSCLRLDLLNLRRLLCSGRTQRRVSAIDVGFAQVLVFLLGSVEIGLLHSRLSVY